MCVLERRTPSLQRLVQCSPGLPVHPVASDSYEVPQGTWMIRSQLIRERAQAESRRCARMLNEHSRGRERTKDSVNELRVYIAICRELFRGHRPVRQQIRNAKLRDCRNGAHEGM